MAKQLWCWGDIISPDLAEKALIAEADRQSDRQAGRGRKTAASDQQASATPVRA